MPEWLVERGIGETRSALIEGGEIVDDHGSVHQSEIAADGSDGSVDFGVGPSLVSAFGRSLRKSPCRYAFVASFGHVERERPISFQRRPGPCRGSVLQIDGMTRGHEFVFDGSAAFLARVETRESVACFVGAVRFNGSVILFET